MQIHVERLEARNAMRGLSKRDKLYRETVDRREHEDRYWHLRDEPQVPAPRQPFEQVIQQRWDLALLLLLSPRHYTSERDLDFIEHWQAEWGATLLPEYAEAVRARRAEIPPLPEPKAYQEAEALRIVDEFLYAIGAS